MPGVNVSFDLRGVEELRGRIDAAIRKGKDFSPALKKTGMLMYASIAKNFRMEGRPERWKPLKRVTIARRRKGPGVGSPKILQDTGRLRQSVTSAHGPNSIYRLSSTQLVLGTNLKYARIHQEGGTTGPVTIVPRRKKALHWINEAGQHVFAKKVNHPGSKIPARPFLIFQEEDKRNIKALMLEHLMEVWQ